MYMERTAAAAAAAQDGAAREMTARSDAVCREMDGRLPKGCGNMAFPYIAMQREDAQRYEDKEALLQGTLFPGLDLPFRKELRSRFPKVNEALLELMALEKLCPLRGPLSDQPMLDLLFAIALPAIASALLFNVGASSGGTDVIALIVEKYTHIHNVAVALFLTDLFMVIAACFVFDLYTALYSFVGLTVKSLVIDAVLEKIKMCKAILIVCDDRKPICDFVMRKLVRGATYTPCFGAYTDKPHYIIYTTLTRREADQLQDFIHKQHLNAFMSMLSTTEVFGKGFNHA